MSNVPFYQSEIDNLFAQLLAKKSVSEKTISNYRSDSRAVLEWLTQNLAATGVITTNTQSLLAAITSEQLLSYRDNQLASGAPTATVNRRLSAIRTLFTLAQEAGLISANPALTLRNADVLKDTKTLSQNEIVSAFEQSLRDQGAADTTIKNYVSDTQQFLNWLSTKTATG